MPRLNRKEMQKQTRERLLAAAQNEIVQKGIADASIRDIAEAAGYSLGAFYSNFESKDAMLREMVDIHMREEIRAFRAIASEAVEGKKEEVWDKISAWLRKLQKSKAPSVLTFELQMYANRNPQFRNKFNSAKTKRIQELAEGLKTLFALHGLQPRIDFLQMANGLAALWDGFSIQGNLPGSRPADHVILVFLKALLESSKPAK